MATNWKQLAASARPYFSRNSIDRGQRYFEEQRVQLERIGESEAEARVRGSRRDSYDVWIGRDDETGFADFECTCPASRHDPCKHVFATLLALEGPPSERWRRKLDKFAQPTPRDPWGRVPGLGGRPVFELLGARAGRDDGVSLRVLRRRRLADGTWSAPGPMNVRKRVRFEPDGEALYDRVHAAATESRYHAQGPANFLSLHGPAARHTLLELARANALYFGGTKTRRRAQPLPLDDGEPYVFRMRLERGTPVRLSAEFTRGDRRVALDEPAMILAAGLMVLDGALVPVDLGGAGHWARQLQRTGPLEVPPEGYPALVEALTAHGGPLPLDPPLPRIEAPPVVPRIRLRGKLAYDPRHGYGPRHIAAHVEFQYGDAVVPAESPAEVCVDPTSGATMPRDFDRESALLERLLKCGVRPGDPIDGTSARMPQIEGAAIVGKLLRDGWAVEDEGQSWRTHDAFSFRVTTGIDWFELEGGLRFDEQTVGLPEILKALDTGQPVVALPDGTRGVLPEGLEERLRLLTHLASHEDGALRFEKSQGWLLDALLAEQDADVDADASFRALRKKIARFESIRPRDASSDFAGTLRPYQRDALGWLQFLEAMPLGGCLADDMGLGKTVMVLAHLLHHRRATEGEARRPALVVAPKSLAWNWIDEARRFAPSLRVLDYSGPATTRDPGRIAAHDLVVTTYGVLRRDAPTLKEIPLGYAILDEAQNVKNPASQTWKAARLLQAEHRLALTGTPVENHLGDLWAILEFLNPGMLGPRATHRAWAKGDGPDGALRARVARLVRPIVLRRTKAQVLQDLPERQDTLLQCDMGPTQRRLYDELLDHYRAILLGKVDAEGLAKSKFQVLEALLRLRQCACHPGLLDDKRAAQPAAKFDALLPLLEEVCQAGSKALVFSQFTSLLALLRKRLDAADIKYAYLDGKTRNRAAVVRAFVEAPDTPLFLISLKAGGVGLNLTAADHVFLLDPWWNPAVERQAVDRTHRIGQTRTVNVYRLVAAGTVEDRILELQARKRALATAVISEDAGLLRKLSRDDLAALLER